MLQLVQQNPACRRMRNVILIVCAMVGWLPAASADEPQAVVGDNQRAPRQIIEYETAALPFVVGTAEIWDTALSPNGQLLATAAADGKIRVYDRATRELRQLVVCHNDSIASLAFSPDGSLLATAGYDQAVKIWRMPELRLHKTLMAHTSRVVSVAFSPNGKRGASCGYDGTIRVWNATTGEVSGTIDGHHATVRCVAFSHDGMLLASGGDDNVVRLWDAATLEPSTAFEGHQARIRAVAFAPQDDALASVGEDGATHIWDLRGQQHSRVLQFGVEAWRLAFSSSGDTLATGYRDGSIRLIDVATGRTPAELDRHSDAISSLMFLPDDQTLYSGSYDGTLLAWNARLPAQPAVARMPTEKKVWALAISPLGDHVAAAGRGGFVQIRDLLSGKLVRNLEGHPATVDRVEYSRDGQLIAAAGWRSSEVLIYQTNGGAKQHTLQADSNVRAVAFSPDGRYLAAACEDKQLIVWELAEGTQVAQVMAHQLTVYDVTYSPDGQTLLTCSGDWRKPLPGRVKLWKASSLTQLAQLEGHSTAVRSAVFRPDGLQVASASERGLLKLWDVQTHLELATFQNSAGTRAIAYSANGKFIAAALQDGTINIWDVANEAVVRRLRGDDDMFSVRFALGDSVLCGAGGDRRVLFWDMSSLNPGSTTKWFHDWSSNDKQE